MEISLKEKYVLLSIDDETGSREKGSYYFAFGLAACILLEMMLDKSISVRHSKVYIDKPMNPKRIVTRDVVQLIKGSRKPKTLKYWVSRVSQKAGRYKGFIIRDLVNAGVLNKVKRRFLFFTYYRYPTYNPNPEKKFRAELIQMLEAEHITLEADLALLAILESSKLLSVLYTEKETLKKAQTRIKNLTRANQFGAAFTKAIEEMQAAVVSTVVVTAAVT